MSGMGRIAILAFAAAATLCAQITVRSGQTIRSTGAALPSTGVSSTPTAAPPAVTGTRSDARMGAGGAGMRTGNIVYPGTPNGGRPGSITSPGLPNPPSRPTSILTPGTPPPPSVQQPPPASLRSDGGGVRGRGRHRDRLSPNQAGYVPTYWPVYGYVYEYGGPSVVEVQPEVATDSQTTYTVDDGAAEPPVGTRIEGRSKVYEVREQDKPAEAQGDYWLIALKGGLIYAAERFWMQNETFRFKTMAGKEFIVSPVEVDVEFTQELNGDRGREFQMP